MSELLELELLVNIYGEEPAMFAGDFFLHAPHICRMSEERAINRMNILSISSGCADDFPKLKCQCRLSDYEHASKCYSASVFGVPHNTFIIFGNLYWNVVARHDSELTF